MNICVIGAGYVGLSNAILFSTKHKVICYDIDQRKVNDINNKISPIKDDLITKYLKTKKLNLSASLDFEYSVSKSKFIIVATPTNFNIQRNSFDISSIDGVLKKLSKLQSSAIIVLKSTLPVGYTSEVNKKYKNLKIYFSPEFLREGKALYDNLYPSRIVIGDKDQNSQLFVKSIKSLALKENIKTIFMQSSEAESVKLFSNTYLATRVAFFNELDSYCIKNNLNTKSIIEGVSLDSRIGTGYNNPSFGYGGYCLPKDTKQLKSSFGEVPNALIKSLNRSNQLRKKYIADNILQNNTKNIGIYMLAMKKHSDNFRESSIIDIIKLLKKNGRNVIIYEPSLKHNKTIFGCKIINDFELFIKKSNLILTNRNSEKLKKVSNKIYTRDLYGEN